MTATLTPERPTDRILNTVAEKVGRQTRKLNAAKRDQLAGLAALVAHTCPPKRRRFQNYVTVDWRLIEEIRKIMEEVE